MQCCMCCNDTRLTYNYSLSLDFKELYHHNVCSTSDLDKQFHFRHMMEQNLEAWHKFVPRQSAMTKSNCWLYSGNLSLPSQMEKKIRSFGNFNELPFTFSKKELSAIINSFNDRNENATQIFCLPKFYLIGFPKCGTTLLYQYIETHPLFAKPRDKEGQFWREYVKYNAVMFKELQVFMYLFHFYSATKQIHTNQNRFTIDASASTVFSLARPIHTIEYDMCSVPVTIFNALPNSKFVVILRNPIDRLWSDFWYFCSRTTAFQKKKRLNLVPDSEKFHNYTLSAIRDFNTCLQKHNIFHCVMLAGMVGGEEVACADVRLGLGVYFVHLERWLSVFPRDQILAIRMDDLVSNPVMKMNEVWSFLGVPSFDVVPIRTKVNSNSRNAYKMLPETRRILSDFFSPHNRMLAKILDNEGYLWN